MLLYVFVFCYFSAARSTKYKVHKRTEIFELDNIERLHLLLAGRR